MVLYPGTEKEARISAETMQNIVTGIFQRCGMDFSDASQLADTLIDADLCGIHSHGVMRVPNYVKRMTKQGVDPRGKPSIVKDSGSVFVIDAGNNMGQISGTFAMRNTIERARTTGVAVAAVGGSNHCGAMYYYAQMAIEEDMIGVATTNALPTMAPWGGSERILGMNPIAVAIPAEKEAYGYLSEHHSYGETDSKAGEYTEDLAATMLATVLGVDFDPDSSWDNKKELWKISGKIVRTRNVTQSAIGDKKGLWTTVLAASILLP